MESPARHGQRRRMAVSALVRACSAGDHRSVKQALQGNTDFINDNYEVLGFNALHAAASFNYVSIVRDLLDAGASVNVKASKTLDTALHCAAELEDPAIVQLLLDAGAKKDVTNARGQLPLHVALLHNKKGAARLLADSPSAPPELYVYKTFKRRLQVRCTLPLTNDIYNLGAGAPRKQSNSKSYLTKVTTLRQSATTEMQKCTESSPEIETTDTTTTKFSPEEKEFLENVDADKNERARFLTLKLVNNVEQVPLEFMELSFRKGATQPTLNRSGEEKWRSIIVPLSKPEHVGEETLIFADVEQVQPSQLQIFKELLEEKGRASLAKDKEVQREAKKGRELTAVRGDDRQLTRDDSVSPEDPEGTPVTEGDSRLFTTCPTQTHTSNCKLNKRSPNKIIIWSLQSRYAQLQIEGLESAQEYYLRARFINVVGTEGHFSKTLTVTTQADYPLAPMLFPPPRICHEAEHTVLTSAPHQGSRNAKETAAAAEVEDEEKGKGEEDEEEADGEVNKNEWVCSSPRDRRKAERSILDVVYRTATEVELVWNKPFSYSQPILRYQVQAEELQRDKMALQRPSPSMTLEVSVENLRRRSLICLNTAHKSRENGFCDEGYDPSEDQCFFLLGGLVTGASYAIAVRAQTKVGWGTWSTRMVVDTLVPPWVQSTTDTTVTLAWGKNVHFRDEIMEEELYERRKQSRFVVTNTARANNEEGNDQLDKGLSTSVGKQNVKKMMPDVNGSNGDTKHEAPTHIQKTWLSPTEIHEVSSKSSGTIKNRECTRAETGIENHKSRPKSVDLMKISDCPIAETQAEIRRVKSTRSGEDTATMTDAGAHKRASIPFQRQKVMEERSAANTTDRDETTKHKGTKFKQGYTRLFHVFMCESSESEALPQRLLRESKTNGDNDEQYFASTFIRPCDHHLREKLRSREDSVRCLKSLALAAANTTSSKGGASDADHIPQGLQNSACSGIEMPVGSGALYRPSDARLANPSSWKLVGFAISDRCLTISGLRSVSEYHFLVVEEMRFGREKTDREASAMHSDLGNGQIDEDETPETTVATHLFAHRECLNEEKAHRASLMLSNVQRRNIDEDETHTPSIIPLEVQVQDINGPTTSRQRQEVPKCTNDTRSPEEQTLKVDDEVKGAVRSKKTKQDNTASSNNKSDFDFRDFSRSRCSLDDRAGLQHLHSESSFILLPPILSDAAVSETIMTADSPPAKVNKIILLEASQYFMTVRWNHPRSNGQDIDAFDIRVRGFCTRPTKIDEGRNLSRLSESRTPHSERVHTIPPGTEGITEFKAQQLMPGWYYIFSVRSHNAKGWSEFSKEESSSTFTTLSTPPFAPRNVSSIATSPNAMKVTWEPSWHGGCEIDEYEVRLCSIHGGKQGDNRFHRKVPEATDTFEALDKLEKKRAMMDARANSPLEYHVGINDGAGGADGEEEIRQKLRSLYTNLVVASSGVLGTHFFVENLLPGTEYRVTVRAKNRIGWGEFSRILDTFSVTTPATVPSPVRPIELWRRNRRSLGIFWESPRANGSPVTNYRVEIRQLESEEWIIPLSIGESSSSVHGSRPFIEYENLPGNSSEDSLHVAFSELIKATVSNLLPGEGYYIRVKARNDLGWSEHVFEPEYNVFHTESCSPDAVSVFETQYKTSNSICCRWQVPRDNGEAITKYSLHYKASGASVWHSVDTQWASSDHGAFSIEIRDLQPGERYDLRIRAHNAKGNSLWAFLNGESTNAGAPDAPRNLQCIFMEDGSQLQISWELPDKDNGEPIGRYELQVSSSFLSGWQRIGDDIRGCVVRVDKDSKRFAADSNHWPKSISSNSPIQHTDNGSSGFVVVSDASPPSSIEMCRSSRDHSTGTQSCLNATVTDDAPARGSYRHLPLFGGVPHSFRVRAHNRVGWGDYCYTETSVMLPATRPLPPGGPHVVKITSTYFELSWSYPSHDGGQPVDFYEVQARGIVEGTASEEATTPLQCSFNRGLDGRLDEADNNSSFSSLCGAETWRSCAEVGEHTDVTLPEVAPCLRSTPWIVVGKKVNEQTFPVFDLDEGYYQFRVRAKNDKGWSQFAYALGLHKLEDSLDIARTSFK